MAVTFSPLLVWEGEKVHTPLNFYANSAQVLSAFFYALNPLR